MGLIGTVLGLITALVLAFFAGRWTHECPKPPDPTTIIQEMEVIRYRDKPVIVEVEKRVETIINTPFYVDGVCLDNDGLHAVQDLIKGTAAGRGDPGAAADGSAGKR